MREKLELKSCHEVIDTVDVADVDSIFQGKPTDPDILTVVMKDGKRLYCDEVCPIDSTQEEPVSEDLEKEIDRAHRIFYDEVGWDSDEGARAYVADWFAHYFANWQKHHMEANRLAHCNSITNDQAELEQGFIDQHLDKHDRMPTFLDAIEYGMRLQKEQMMEQSIGNNYTKKTLLTMKEYEAIVWAYATLQCEVGNNTLPEYSVKEAKAVIDIIDEFTERVQKQRLIE